MEHSVNVVIDKHEITGNQIFQDSTSSIREDDRTDPKAATTRTGATTTSAEYPS
ncbi:uncharacterized protein METZ01_LOCUS180434 [marine metagenome]|uniref:Uncharacterized protein n=1 Tax=marine metagenome TaxID=408172 RepID=A0A382CN84_9ZZZZ